MATTKRPPYPTLFLAIILLLLNSNSVSAETGTVDIKNTTIYGWYTIQGNVYGYGSPVTYWDRLLFDNATYNSPQVLQVRGTNVLSYLKESGSTTFTCTGMNICTGYVVYYKADNTITWYFYDGARIRTTPITLSYVSNIFTDISFVSSPDWVWPHGYTNQPFCVVTVPSGYPDTCVVSAGGSKLNYSGIFHTIVTNNYIVTYPSAGFFSIFVDKSPTAISTKVSLHDISKNNYFIESTYNTVNVSYAGNLANSLWLNLSLTNGQYSDILINSSVANYTGSYFVVTDKTEYITGNSVNVGYFSPFSGGLIMILKVNSTTGVTEPYDSSQYVYGYGMESFPKPGHAWNYLAGSWRVRLYSKTNSTILAQTNFTISLAPTVTPQPTTTVNLSTSTSLNTSTITNLTNITNLDKTYKITNATQSFGNYTSNIQSYNYTSQKATLSTIMPVVFSAIPNEIWAIMFLIASIALGLNLIGRN